MGVMCKGGNGEKKKVQYVVRSHNTGVVFQLTQKHVGVLMPSCICAVAFSKDFAKLAKLGTC